MENRILYDFRYPLDREDYAAFNRFMLYRRPEQKKAVRTLKLLLAIPCLVAAALFLTIGTGFYRIVPTIGFSLMACIIFFGINSRRSVGKAVGKMVDQAEKDGMYRFGEDHGLTFEEGCYRFCNREVNCVCLYSHLGKIYLCGKYVFLENNDRSGVILPVAVFDGIEQKDEFLQWLSCKIGKTPIPVTDR